MSLKSIVTVPVGRSGMRDLPVSSQNTYTFTRYSKRNPSMRVLRTSIGKEANDHVESIQQGKSLSCRFIKKVRVPYLLPRVAAEPPGLWCKGWSQWAGLPLGQIIISGLSMVLRSGALSLANKASLADQGL